jgi:hypothetical protein
MRNAIDNQRVSALDPTQTLDRMRRLLGSRFEELAGSRVDAELPLTNTVLNALIAERLRASDTPVQQAEVQVRSEGEF